jgi:hypothetical protein
MALPQATINVASTTGFPAMGTIAINLGGNWTLVTYTGTTATSFTGCVGGTGTMAMGQVVTSGTQPQNTFFRHNSIETSNPSAATANQTLDIPFVWLTHLDRPVLNGLELLYVSAYRPHEVTQQFVTTTSVNAPWSDYYFGGTYTANVGNSAMLFRALEVLGVPSYLNGTTLGGRVPGKVNINTMNEMEIFQALCDANASFSSGITTTDVANIFGNLLASRSQGPGWTPSASDRPFRSFSAGWIQSGDAQYANGSGIDDTLLRNFASGGTTLPLFWKGALGNNHPYQQFELLQKIYNNVTTTSNAFALWLTVGFFEVQDTDSAGNAIVPPKIGSEIGRDQGRQIRHRMFAIIDRTGLNLAQAQVPPTGSITAGSNVAVTLSPINSNVPAALNTMVGNMLDIGPDPATGLSEVVLVKAVDCSSAGSPAIVADFVNSYGPNTPVTFRGNPGPQPRMLLSTASNAIAAGANTVQVSGTVSNVMLAAGSNTITIGPDPTTGNTEQVTVLGINTTNPANPTLAISATTNAYTAGTPISWTSSVLYNPRNDPNVVLHFTIIQ